ncbi:MAG UNVERIFIED_CONTAM: hypothetical protein LVT10_09270 [Anaerolineae bacterium]
MKGNTIEIVIAGEALGRPATLEDARVYVALWGLGGHQWGASTPHGGRWAVGVQQWHG